MTTQQAIYIILKTFIRSEVSVAARCDFTQVHKHGPIIQIRQKMARLEVQY
jgi:hypothetical protein